MILDTGASGLAFTDRQYSGFGFLRPENADRGGSMGVGGKRAGFHFYVKDIKLGPIFRDSAEASLSLDGTMPEPLLGASFLRDLHFTIEPQLKQIVFQNP
jgi:predicted aspartyl protease